MTTTLVDVAMNEAWPSPARIQEARDIVCLCLRMNEPSLKALGDAGFDLGMAAARIKARLELPMFLSTRN